MQKALAAALESAHCSGGSGGTAGIVVVAPMV